jgi:hypothetical protein
MKKRVVFYLSSLLPRGFLRSAFQVFFFNISSDVCVGKDILFCRFGSALAVATAKVNGF